MIVRPFFFTIPRLPTALGTKDHAPPLAADPATDRDGGGPRLGTGARREGVGHAGANPRGVAERLAEPGRLRTDGAGLLRTAPRLRPVARRGDRRLDRERESGGRRSEGVDAP